MGKVAGLWRYPIKSMGGESCQSFVIDERGVRADRKWAVLNRDGFIGSGKSTRRFRRIDGLLELSGVLGEDGVAWVRFPDGRRLAAGTPALDEALSASLHEPVQLALEGDVHYLDAGQVHLISTASLGWLASDLDSSAADERRFRANLIIEADDGVLAGDGRAEREWIGQRLRIGDVVLAPSEPAERCVMTTASQFGLSAHKEVLKHLVTRADSCFGIYADVIAGGTVRVGDKVRLESV